MKKSPPVRALSWFSPEFGLQGVFLEWCGVSDGAAPVQGVWQRRWLGNAKGTGEESLSGLFGGPVPGGAEQQLWVGNERTAEELRAAGFSRVDAVGLPAVYVPSPVVERESGSLLILLTGEDSGAWESMVEALLSQAPPHMEGVKRAAVCLPPEAYRSRREWVWRLRFSGVRVLSFEEDPLDAGSLREAAALFCLYERVTGNAPGHWLPHAALRGARVFRMHEGSEWAGFGWLPGAPSEAVDAREWGGEELGEASRVASGELASKWGWKPHDSGEEAQIAKKAPVAWCELLDAQRVVFELVQEGKLEAGRGAYASLRALWPRDPHLVLVNALIARMAGEVQSALELLEGSGEGLRTHPVALAERGETLLMVGQTEMAREVFKELTASFPNLPNGFLGGARVLEASGMQEQAAVLFRHGLKLARSAPADVLWPLYGISQTPGRVLMVSCTAKSEAERDALTLLRSFRETLAGHGGEVDLDITFSNREGLAAVYNRKLQAAAMAGYEFALFVHDDVYLDDARMLAKLRQGRKEHGFGLMGVAGCAEASVQYPSLWHQMAKRESRRGAAWHFLEGERFQAISSYGPTPAPVDLLDGVLMAVHVPSAMAVGWSWNEAFRFHHYDLAGSLDALRKGMQPGVVPIHLVHSSPGLKSMNDPEWTRSDEIFRRQYGKPEPRSAVDRQAVAAPPPAQGKAPTARTRSGGAEQTFKHSGDLGDIIYSLAAIQRLGGGILYLDTSGGADEEICRSQCMEGKTKFNEAGFAFVKPLIEAQPYIREVRRYAGESVDFNLNNFRHKFNDPNSRSKTKNLLDLHLEAFGLPEWDPNEAWLHVGAPVFLERKTLVSRTPRYQSNFPWFQSNKFRFRDEAVFIGLPKEHEYFEWTFDIKIPYHPVKDALEMARVIAGAETFVANQTCSLAIAIGLGTVSVVQEVEQHVPNTVFQGKRNMKYI